MIQASAGYIGGFAHQLWLAALGALAIVEKESTRIFNELVKEGKQVEKQRANKDTLAAAVVSAKEAYQKKLEARLKEWDEQLDLLVVKAEKLTFETRDKVEAEIAGLKARRVEAQKRLDELRQRGEDAWEELKDGAEQVWGDISDALKKAVTHFK